MNSLYSKDEGNNFKSERDPAHEDLQQPDKKGFGDGFLNVLE
jgi:hypothetical protein